MDLSSIDDWDRDAEPEPPPPCAEEAPWLALELELEDLPPPEEVEECDAGFDIQREEKFDVRLLFPAASYRLHLFY